MNRQYLTRGLLLVAVLVLAGCAAGPNNVADVNAPPELAGFWLGLWHGLISPITFLISLFTQNVSIYEVHNNGNWYDFGFMFGIAIVFSGPARLGTGAPRPRQRSSAS
ncbi:MAG TPA: hypothetical protein VD813_00145 [Pseudonocardia sp.]|nr:hypothetical protein [Pseudonocardia sp.]